MNAFRPLILLAIPMMLLACAAGAPAPHPPTGDAPQSLPATFVVSTNEPFWQARVEGKVVQLTGPDQQRTLQVLSNEAVVDGRVVTARDTLGMLELRVTERLCMDSMSGASFVYTARLVFDKEPPVEGCGKPIAGK